MKIAYISDEDYRQSSTDKDETNIKKTRPILVFFENNSKIFFYPISSKRAPWSVEFSYRDKTYNVLMVQKASIDDKLSNLVIDKKSVIDMGTYGEKLEDITTTIRLINEINERSSKRTEISKDIYFKNYLKTCIEDLGMSEKDAINSLRKVKDSYISWEKFIKEKRKLEKERYLERNPDIKERKKKLREEWESKNN
ncbi:MAG: hypothetical protein HRS57_00750 [Mycoplasmataceae bacterium]|nr:hypothetical protein [Mycoplasmataceae bacterium]